MSKKSVEIGFGTSGIMGAAASDRGRINLLEHCFEEGIRHFDTAPLYGVGDAEQLLGKFAKNKRDQIRIASKFGLPPPHLSHLQQAAKPVLRYLNRRSSLINNLASRLRQSQLRRKSTAKPEANSIGATNSTGIKLADENARQYDVATLESELDASLQELKTDYLDYYLFHECFSDQVSAEVLSKLEDFVSAGKILNYGIATSWANSHQLLEARPDFAGVVQVAFDNKSVSYLASRSNSTVFHSLFRSDLYRKIDVLMREQPTTASLIFGRVISNFEAGNLPLQICINYLFSELPNANFIFSSKSKTKISETTSLFHRQRVGNVDWVSLFDEMNKLDFKF